MSDISLTIPSIQRLDTVEAQSLIEELQQNSADWVCLPIQAGNNDWKPEEFVRWFEAMCWLKDEAILKLLVPVWGAEDGLIDNEDVRFLGQRKVMFFSFQEHYIALTVPVDRYYDEDKLVWLWRPKDLEISAVDPYAFLNGTCQPVESFWPLFLFLLNRSRNLPDFDIKCFSEIGQNSIYEYLKMELNEHIPMSQQKHVERRI